MIEYIAQNGNAVPVFARAFASFCPAVTTGCHPFKPENKMNRFAWPYMVVSLMLLASLPLFSQDTSDRSAAAQLRSAADSLDQMAGIADEPDAGCARDFSRYFRCQASKIESGSKNACAKPKCSFGNPALAAVMEQADEDDQSSAEQNATSANASAAPALQPVSGKSYDGPNAQWVQQLLARVGSWSCPSSGTAHDGVPPQVKTDSSSIRDQYVKSAVLQAWAAECYQRQGRGAEASAQATAMRTNLQNAQNLCGGNATFGPATPTADIYRCGELLGRVDAQPAAPRQVAAPTRREPQAAAGQGDDSHDSWTAWERTAVGWFHHPSYSKSKDVHPCDTLYKSRSYCEQLWGQCTQGQSHKVTGTAVPAC